MSNTYNQTAWTDTMTKSYKEIKMNMLQKLFQLYLRIRASALCKKKTDQLKFKNETRKRNSFTKMREMSSTMSNVLE